MYKLHYLRHTQSMHKGPPSLIFFVCSVRYQTPQNKFQIQFKNLQEFETDFENISGYESGVYMRSIHEKTRDRKSCATVQYLNLFIPHAHTMDHLATNNHENLFLPAVLNLTKHHTICSAAEPCVGKHLFT